MCTHNQCFEQKKKRKKYYNFSSKNNFFLDVKYCSILHGHVFIMNIYFGIGRRVSPFGK